MTQRSKHSAYTLDDAVKVAQPDPVDGPQFRCDRQDISTLAPTASTEQHVSSIFTKLDLPLAADDHRRVLTVLTFLRA